MSSARKQRVGEAIRDTLSQMIAREVKDPRVTAAIDRVAQALGPFGGDVKFLVCPRRDGESLPRDENDGPARDRDRDGPSSEEYATAPESLERRRIRGRYARDGDRGGGAKGDRPCGANGVGAFVFAGGAHTGIVPIPLIRRNPHEPRRIRWTPRR